MLNPAADYDTLYGQFSWALPGSYNIAWHVCDRHAAATPGSPALVYESLDGNVTTYDFAHVQKMANRVANMLAADGIAPGDRVAVILPQCLETAVSHLGAFKLGAISVPMFAQLGEGAFRHRLIDSGASVIITNRAVYARLGALLPELLALRSVYLVDGPESGVRDFTTELARASDRRETLATTPDTPAMLYYTSGTTGRPKGVLHAHRSLLGVLPGVELCLDFFGQKGDFMWSPADWAWLGGLLVVLLPTWAHGKPILVQESGGRFDPERAYHMLARHGVRNVLLVATMLKLMRQVVQPPALGLRSIFMGGESVGEELLRWGEAQFGVPLAECYGQTECAMAVAHAPRLMSAKPGALGRPAPGHRAAILDRDGQPLAPGDVGEIALARPDPAMLLGYWNDPEATAAKFKGEWMMTGDLGLIDADGYFWFRGRADDVISSAGYRIGPDEIEECLNRHPAVAMVAAIGVPDPVRGEVVKAFIVPADGAIPGPELEDDIRAHARERLAAYERPREIEFVVELPTTVTGKIMRRALRDSSGDV
jgi:acetyl-CoA synthetase